LRFNSGPTDRFQQVQSKVQMSTCRLWPCFRHQRGRCSIRPTWRSRRSAPDTLQNPDQSSGYTRQSSAVRHLLPEQRGKSGAAFLKIINEQLLNHRRSRCAEMV